MSGENEKGGTVRYDGDGDGVDGAMCSDGCRDDPIEEPNSGESHCGGEFATNGSCDCNGDRRRESGGESHCSGGIETNRSCEGDGARARGDIIMGDKDGGESKCGGGTVLNGATNVDVSVETRRKADVDGPQNEGFDTVRNRSDR